jgi:site-specific DNA-methyltransferase (adenine-specific)
MKKRENVLVFSDGATIHQSQSKRRMPYYPQGLAPNHRDHIVNFNKRKQIVGYRPSRQKPRTFANLQDTRTQCSNSPSMNSAYHPVAKPVGLLEFLIETYTRPGEIVLDSAMGTGSTGVAAANTGRPFIGIAARDLFKYEWIWIKHRPTGCSRRGRHRHRITQPNTCA